MSRNLCDTSCAICGNDIVLVGPEHLITEEEAGYMTRYNGNLWVADAECRRCAAKYLAWVRVTPRSDMDCGHWQRRTGDDRPFVDLSFRRAFNDEPAPEDLPTPAMLAELHEAEYMAAAKRLRDQAAALIQEAIEIEDKAATGKSHWEAYRR